MDLLPKRRSRRGSSFNAGTFGITSKFNEGDLRLWEKIRWKQIIILLFSFTAVVHYFERIKPRWVLNSCDWSKWEDWPDASTPHHSLVYGDPQIIDDYSYPKISKGSLWFFQWLTDNYLHRNHQLINSILNPHSILFIGDLFDGGRLWDNNKWYSEYKRFNEIFNPLPNVRQYKQIPGNHDVGFGMGVDFHKYSRFKSYFGAADDYVVLGNHSVILMDTVSLSCNNDTRIRMGSETFLNSLADPNHPSKEYPRILLTHVPLYRFTEKQTCGPLREDKSPFPVVRGEQYQTVLEFGMSQKIIDFINPSIIFSGDDHDYCHIRHPLGQFMSHEIDHKKMEAGKPGVDYANEITVKSSAMSGGIKKPAIQLISMWNPKDNTISDDWKLPKGEGKVVDSMTVKTELCYLPSPYQPITHYTIYLTLSIMWMFVCTVPIKYGTTLNLRVNHYVKRLVDLIKRVRKNNSVNLSEMEPKKHDDKYSRVIKMVFLDWNISKRRDWIDFFVNSILITVGFFLILIVYFKSI